MIHNKLNNIHIYIYTENNIIQAPVFGGSHLPCSSTRPVVFHVLDGPRLGRCLNHLSLVCFCWHSLATGSSVFVGELRPLSSSGGGRQKIKIKIIPPPQKKKKFVFGPPPVGPRSSWMRALRSPPCGGPGLCMGSPEAFV